MTTFNKNKAPKGWMFPFTKKELKSLFEETNAIFDSVNFENTQKPSEFSNDTLWFWIGILESKRINNEYHFSLELSSFKNEYISPWKEKIKEYVFPEIKKWVASKLNLPSNAPEKPTRLFLKYEIKNGICSSSCYEVD